MKVADYKIFTIGHGSRTIVDFISLLNANEIEILIDVRSYPYSRYHPQFRKSELEVMLNKAGIEYLFLGDELGGRPKNPNMYIDGKVSYRAIKKSGLFNEGIKKILQLVRDEIKVTLMCSEADQNQCHRKTLITEELILEGISVIHINKFGKVEEENRNQNVDLFS